MLTGIVIHLAENETLVTNIVVRHKTVQPADTVIAFFLATSEEYFVDSVLHVGCDVERDGDVVQLLVVFEPCVLWDVVSGFLEPFEPGLAITRAVCYT